MFLFPASVVVEGNGLPRALKIGKSLCCVSNTHPFHTVVQRCGCFLWRR